jgi:hypothetical protein
VTASARRRAALGAARARAAAAPARGAAGGDGIRSWYVPDHAKVQFAGEMGLVSPGVGYELLGHRLQSDLFFGWVPASIGGDDVFSATAKLTLVPWRIQAGHRWRVHPLSVSTQLTYTFGSQYFLTPPGRYPRGYYDVPTALHTAVGVGGCVVRPLRSKSRELGVYYELVAANAMILRWLENRAALSLVDIVSVAVGARLRF